VRSTGVVSLSWTANTEPDLLGYLVYRREPPALNPVRLTAAPLQTTTFTDRAVRAGATYVYTVTAVDRSPRRNESAPSSEVFVTLP
jgi:fibronectin type 3 domain-containing protein